MTIKIGGDVVVDNNQRAEFSGLNIGNIPEPPKEEGMLWLDTSDNTLKIWNGFLWLPISLP